MATALAPGGQRGPAAVEEGERCGGWGCTGPRRRELCRKLFRALCYRDAPGLREALARLRVLCRLWLRPERHTKEQILDLLVLEQFLSILPADLRAWVQAQHPETGEEAVAALEELERELDEPPEHVGRGVVAVRGSVGQGLWSSQEKVSGRTVTYRVTLENNRLGDRAQ